MKTEGMLSDCSMYLVECTNKLLHVILLDLPHLHYAFVVAVFRHAGADVACMFTPRKVAKHIPLTRSARVDDFA